MSEKNEELELLRRIAASLESQKKETSRRSKIWLQLLPIWIALLGLFGTVSGYFYTEYQKNERMKDQAEYDFMLSALSSGNDGRDKLANLTFLSSSGLIPDNKDNMTKAMNHAYVSVENDLVFLTGKDSSEMAWELHDMAYEFAEMSQFRDAANLFRRSIEHDSTNYSSHNLLGYCYMNMLDYDRAIQTLKKAVETDPEHNHYFNYHYQAESYYAIGHPCQARMYFELAYAEAEEMKNEDKKEGVQRWLDIVEPCEPGDHLHHDSHDH